MNTSSGIKTVKSVITANSPVLLVGTAIAGVVTTGVLAAKAGYKARGIVDAEQARRDLEDTSAPLTVQEKFSLTWLCYASPALTGVSTIAACVGVHTIHNKRHAALAGLYAVTSTQMDNYKEKAEELLGPKKTQTLNDVVAQQRIDTNPSTSHEVMMTGTGHELCYDDQSGRWFMGSMSEIENAFNETNRMLLENGDTSLNEFYDFVGLSHIPIGNDLGWSGEKVSPRFGACVSPDGRPAISFWFQPEPKPGKFRG